MALLIPLCALLPSGLTLRLCRLAIAFAQWLRPSLRRMALDNLSHASIPDPERQADEFCAWAARHFTRLIHMRSSLEIAPRWTVHGRQNFLEARAGGRPLVLAFFHLGPLEEAVHLFAVEGIHILALFETFPDFPFLQRELQRRRDYSGHRFLDWRDGGRELFLHLNAGGVAAISADMFPNSGGFRMNWLGRDTWVDDKAARVAAMTGAALLPVWAEEDAAHIEAPIDTTDPIQATRELLQLAERRIREHPHLWIWLNQRWREKPA